MILIKKIKEKKRTSFLSSLNCSSFYFLYLCEWAGGGDGSGGVK